jgi:adenylosuccinate synthase
MPVTVVVGGQFGSEGKGKVAHFLAKDMGAAIAIRVGGPNSGHTVISSDGKPIIFRQLPTAALLPNVQCVLPVGSYIRTEILLEEMRIARLDPKRLLIDPSAVLITEREVAEELGSELHRTIGSTQSGTGSAVIARARRTGAAKLARDDKLLQTYVRPTVPFLREQLEENQRVLIEGTQGFGLSVLHSPHYPFTTSRDTTAAGFVAEAGLSPRDVDDVVLVLRAFPIRVRGNSGPLPNEISWDEVTAYSGSRSPITEYTSVTKSVRRVARFDPAVVIQAIAANRPTRLVLNHIDYIDVRCTELNRLTPRAASFARHVEWSIGMQITYLGFSPNHLLRANLLGECAKVM